MRKTYGEPVTWRAGGRTIRRRTHGGRLRKWNAQHAVQRERMLRRTMQPPAARDPRVRRREWGQAIIAMRRLGRSAGIAAVGMDDLSRAIGDYREAQRQQVLTAYAGFDLARGPDVTGIFGDGGGRRGH